MGRSVSTVSSSRLTRLEKPATASINRQWVEKQCSAVRKTWWFLRTPSLMFHLRTTKWAVTVDATAHTTCTKTTEETACLPKTAPACTAGKSFTLVRVSPLTAKPGSHLRSSSSSSSRCCSLCTESLLSGCTPLAAPAIRVSGSAETSPALGSVRCTETATTRPLTPNGIALTDTVSTH